MAVKLASGWSAIISSSAILSLVLLGDALIYAVLPVYADSFGLTLAWVGVLLSANRFIRVFAYGIITKFIYLIGVRRICLIAAVVASISTAIYGSSQGPAILLLGRILYGLAYAALVLVTLNYSIKFRSEAGFRVGISRAIQRVGPITALLIGTWLVGLVGPRDVFIVLAIATTLAIPLALQLPPCGRLDNNNDTWSPLKHPRPIDILFFIQGFGVDGVFAVTIVLIFAEELPPDTAIMFGGALLAMRHIAEAFAAPLFGWLSDRFGAQRIFIQSLFLTIIGFVSIAVGLTVIGAIVMLVFRGALASLGPAVIVNSVAAKDPAIAPLARMQAWRDLGAAFGPLITGFTLSIISPETQHAVVGVALFGGLIFWFRNHRSFKR